jgi:hypothetical protein
MGFSIRTVLVIKKSIVEILTNYQRKLSIPNMTFAEKFLKSSDGHRL